MSTPKHLGGRYTLGEAIGYGGMSEVHIARDERLGRTVAIKLLRPDLARDPRFYLRFRREAQNAAALNHPMIVSVFDTGESASDQGPMPYIVMEYVDGQTLREALQNGPLTTQEVLSWIADVAAALDFSHHNGIVHRDVKPGNIMIDKTGQVKVMDFGIARAISDATITATQTATVIGTAQYLSPEQARGETVDPRSDVYSLGCVLYELLAGAPPFTGDTPLAIAYQHVREDPKPPSSLKKTLTPDIDAVVLKAMSKNPANRYQSAAELRSDVLKLLAGERPSAPRVMSEAERNSLLSSGEITGPTHKPLREHGQPVAEPGSRPRGVYAALVVAVIAALVAAYFAISNIHPVPAGYAMVPNVAGMSEQQATDALRTSGVRYKIDHQESVETKQGNAIGTTPQGGSAVDKNAEVTLTISSGPGQTVVPDLRNVPYGEAITRLSAAGLVEDPNRPPPEFSDEIDKDRVISTQPAANKTALKGTKVQLILSKGPENTQIPNVVGQQSDAATKAITDAGLAPPAFVEQSSTEPYGKVLSQDPQPGSDAKRKSVVTLTISKGDQIAMPDLTGMTEQEARTALRKAGFSGQVTTQSTQGNGIILPDPNKVPGQIFRQDPAPGTAFPKLGTVTIDMYHSG
ncbi:serine/threonine protein kinase with PASTA sensor(s) [Segniliparus rotundus DSM 44985]|uniref:non-specific serine/threonine protein kinase n=1 Tax=Segniliparus rotundus (strain ATCC BAA-972 / CDC 1076 / CIP 108378 / DSM 44985 / JCM 13578) TaxID=640132 RepID=D6ZBA0_SEGRD|nr:Stk1 family PASTA domain-containing Ser/Thr kinase [Segniliparus rotundus]ADG96859.1 serine/threonine protein kinase with PASTA sensor(s) [Segniliparus rotundus DSM 44985]